LTSISGTYLVTQANPDFGHTTRLEGTASLGGHANIPFTGNLNGTGFIARGRAGGTLTFASGSGSLVVSLTGPVQSGFAGLPSQFKYVVTKSVGGLKGIRGAGVATLALQSDGSFAMNFSPGIGKKH
jgi:hypothetical protein